MNPTPYEKSRAFIDVRKSDSALERSRARLLTVAAVVGTQPRPGNDRDHMVAAASAAYLDSDDTMMRLSETVADEIDRCRTDDDLMRYLIFRYRYETYPKTHTLDDFPPLLQIEPTSVCNFRCVFCYQTDTTFTDRKEGHMGLMDLDLFKRVVDEAEGRVDGVTLASRGEPLMHKRIGEMLTYLAGKFVALKINTNATFLTEEASHTILQSGVQTLVISADAAEPDLYSKLRVRGDFEKVIGNVRRFRAIRDRDYPDSRTLLRVSGVKFSDEQSLDDMEGVWGDIVDQVAFVQYNPWENTYTAPENDIATPCSEYWRRTFVLWDGRVAPCDSDYKGLLGVGSVMDESVSRLWVGEGYSRLREAHLTNRRREVFPCNRCTVV